MQKITNALLKEKNRPVHKIRPSVKSSFVARTWCLVDLYRRGVLCEAVNVGDMKATCPTCLKLESVGKAL